METPFGFERLIWTAIKDKKFETLNEKLTDSTAVVYNGKRITPKRLMEIVSGFNIKDFTIDNFEVVLGEYIIDTDSMDKNEQKLPEDMIHQSIYKTRIMMKEESDQSFSGTYFINTSWKNTLKNDELALVMISKCCD